jgi:hypothetical protein
MFPTTLLNAAMRGNSFLPLMLSGWFYLDLLRQAVQLHGLSVIGYCLMSNHVHLVVIPHKTDSLAAALKQTHGVTRPIGMLYTRPAVKGLFQW